MDLTDGLIQMRREKEDGRQNKSEKESCSQKNGRETHVARGQKMRLERGIVDSLDHIIQGHIGHE